MTKETTRRVTSGDDEVVIREAGSDGRPLLFIHGNSMSGDAFRDQLRGGLRDHYRLVAVDLPGHGDSPPASDPSSTYSFGGYRRVIAALLEQLGFTDAILVGHSMGGHVALESQDLASVAKGFVFDAPPVESVASFAAAFSMPAGSEVLFAEEMTPAQASDLATVLVGPVRHEEVTAWLLGTDGRARSSLWASLQAGEFPNEVAVVNGAGKPLAIVHGENDALINRAYIEGLELPALWRGAVQVVANAGHSPQMEAPEALSALIGEFAASVG